MIRGSKWWTSYNYRCIQYIAIISLYEYLQVNISFNIYKEKYIRTKVDRVKIIMKDSSLKIIRDKAFISAIGIKALKLT